MGPIAYLGGTEIIATGNKEFASPSQWDRDPIGETELIRVSGSGYVKWTRWRRIDQIGGAEFEFYWDICGYEKVVEGFWSISLSTLSKQAIKKHLIPF